MRAASARSLLVVAVLVAPAWAEEVNARRCVQSVAEGALLIVGDHGREAAQLMAPCHALPEARVLLCGLAQRLGPAPLAETCATTLRDQPRWAAEAWLATGLRRMHTGDLAGARRDFRVATHDAPDFALARVGRVLIADAAGDPATARREARGLVEHFGRVRSAPDLTLDDPVRAPVAAVDGVIRRVDPACDACWGRLAYLYAQWALRRPSGVNEPVWRGAAAALRVVLERHPDDQESRLSLGDTLGVLHDRKGQYEVYQVGLKLAPRWYAGLLEAGKAALDLGRPAEAAALLEKATALDPAQGEAWSWLGIARLQLGQPNAVAACRRAVAAANPRPEARLELGRALLAAGDPAAARPELERVTASLPDLPAGWYALSRALAVSGKPSQARRAFDRYQEKLDAAQKKIEVEERQHNLSRSSAAALDRLAEGNLVEARRRLQVVAANDPTFPFIALVRAAVAARAGEKPTDADLTGVVALCRAANASLAQRAP